MSSTDKIMFDFSSKFNIKLKSNIQLNSGKNYYWINTYYFNIEAHGDTSGTYIGGNVSDAMMVNGMCFVQFNLTGNYINDRGSWLEFVSGDGYGSKIYSTYLSDSEKHSGGNPLNIYQGIRQMKLVIDTTQVCTLSPNNLLFHIWRINCR